jgi:hypothetical protein
MEKKELAARPDSSSGAPSAMVETPELAVDD